MSPPPGYVGYGGPTAYSGPFQGIRSISKAMVVLLWIYLPLQLLSIYDQLRLSRQASRFLDGSISEQSFKDSVRVNASSVVGLMVVPIAVLTMIWMYRMSANLPNLGRQGRTWAPGWAIASWFVPPCAIYAVPWLMFKELWKGSDPDCAPGDPAWKNSRVSPLVTWWWVLYGLLPILSISSNAQFINEISSDTTTLERAKRYHDYAGSAVVFAVLGIVATVVYLQLVRQLAARHMQSTREA